MSGWNVVRNDWFNLSNFMWFDIATFYISQKFIQFMMQNGKLLIDSVIYFPINNTFEQLVPFLEYYGEHRFISSSPNHWSFKIFQI